MAGSQARTDVDAQTVFELYQSLSPRMGCAFDGRALCSAVVPPLTPGTMSSSHITGAATVAGWLRCGVIFTSAPAAHLAHYLSVVPIVSVGINTRSKSITH
jgi:hypothetical protein